MVKRLKKIPEFRSREEEFDFWATQDSSLYDMGTTETGVGPRSVKITYRKTRPPVRKSEARRPRVV
jgi:hypothetical protein